MKSKVLLIDDSVTIHRVIDLSIDFDRYDIVKVFSKDDASLKIQTEQFDYILLDNKLENIIISEYISEIKQQQNNAHIILLVGAFDKFDESDLEKTNADDYLVKPFDSQSLNAKLSSEADMMPAGIVERIAEADFARDNDDFVAPSAPVTKSEYPETISKKEYLDNLEEEQPDDLTETGYVEDKENETAAAVEQHEDTVQDTADMPNQINNMVSYDDLDVEEDDEEEYSHETIQKLDNDNLDIKNINESTSSAIDDSVSIENVEENAETSDNISDDVSIDNMAIPDPSVAVRNPILPDIENTEDISDDYIMKENLADIDNSNTEILDKFPDFPDVDDISTDEMQDVVETDKDADVDESISSFEAENNYGDDNINLPEVNEEDEFISQESSSDVLEDENKTVDMDSEPLHKDNDTFLNDAPVMEESNEVNAGEESAEEKLLVDDDNWLNDAPVMEESNEANAGEESAEEKLLVDDDNRLNDAPVMEESNEANTGEESIEEKLLVDDDNWLNDAPVMEERREENAGEESAEQVFSESEMPPFDDLLVENESSSDKNADTFNNDGPVSELNYVNEEVEEQTDESYSNVNSVNALNSNMEELIFDNTEQADESIIEDNMAVLHEDQTKEERDDTAYMERKDSGIDNIPVTELSQTQSSSQIKEAEAYSPDSNRFGGITVTISRDEIMAMLGNAIDKTFLEEAVKEVIAANMKEVVRNVVPAIAEKYIKEEIERLKNDE